MSTAKLFPYWLLVQYYLMNIVVLGNVCIDKNNIEKTFYEKAGGPPAFMSLFFNKIKDASFTTIASYGQDFLPYKNSLNLYPLKPNASNTLVYENTIKNGERSQKCYFYKDAFPPVIDKGMTNIIKNSDVLFIAPLIPYFSPDYIKKAVSLASKDCLKILLPQGYFREFDDSDNVIFREFKEADGLLPLFDFVILSSDDYPNIEKLSSSWSKKSGTTFIITKAEKVAIIINKNERVVVPTNPIPLEDVVDSIGAGDIFSASFGYNYFKNKDLVKSARLANKAARKRLLSKTQNIQKDSG